MRARGQGFLTLLLAGILAVGGVAFDRLGPKEPAPAPEGSVETGAWLCPHGGGKGYEGTVFLANPGETEVSTRVTGLTAEGVSETSEVDVPPGGQVEVSVPARDRAASTFVETFGGWVAAGWLVRGAGGEPGLGAEPCTPQASRSWFSAGATTGEGETSFLVVMNPFSTDAVLDVAMFATDRAPVRDSDLTDLTLSPRRSVAIRLNDYAQGEEALGVSIAVASGRAAASTLVVSRDRGIESVVATPAPAARIDLLTSTGAGQSSLSVMVPTRVADQGGDAVRAPVGQLGSTFAATLRSADPPQPAGGLSDQAQEPESAAVYPVATAGASAVDLVVRDGAPVVAALRTVGVGKDDGSTGGSATPASSWIVTPTVAGDPSRPGVLVLNPGSGDASVTVVSLPTGGAAEGTAAETTITVPGGSVGAVPGRFLAAAGATSMLLRSDGSPIVALGASTSLGNEGLSLFGLAAGVPIPESQAP
ncbi:MAG: DUF5719 family protein [Actinomycetota bacterium]